ncbi:MAG TPA: ricin-type beta-trefoil lectin domain protein [Kofleriaceae bacterium]|nr:ricin-type beta-trefoil lectin domain protein [Kofleriaceae bacterium]
MMLLGSAICAAGCTVGDEVTSDDPAAGGAGQASGDPELRTGYITGGDGKPIEVSYSVIDGWAYQDDIGLGPADQISSTPDGATRRSGGFSSYAMSTGQGARWPGNVLYYQLDSTLPAALKNAAVAAVNHYNAFSGATGVRIAEGLNGGKYVRVMPTTGKSRVSQIGYSGGLQYLYLNTTLGWIWQVSVHEFGHAFGLWHEHQRCERNAYLSVSASADSNFSLRCDLPTTQPYNTWSVMHYSPGEMTLPNGTPIATFLPGVRVAPAKSVHPGLIDADLKSLSALYAASATFSAVSLMHGKCLDATLNNTNGTRVVMWDCVQGATEQRWTYNAATGELRMRGTKCLDGWTAHRLDPVVIHDCHGGGNQKWDIGSYGEITLRAIKDTAGRPLCLDIANLDRANGAPLLLQYCHRGDNQTWRRSAGTGGATVSVVSDLPANKCMDAPSATTGTQLHVWDCQGVTNANQRFTRTAAREMRIHGKCLDGHAGNVGDPVKVWDCHGGGNQKWALTPSGEVKGVNNLCVQPTGGGSANGTKLVLAACNNSPAQKWDYRDPR